MKNFLWLFLLSLFVKWPVVAATPADYATLTDWSVACFTKLPEYDHLSGYDIINGESLSEVYKTTLTAQQFKDKMEKFAKRSKQKLQVKDNWVSADAPQDSLFDIQAKHDNEFEHAFIQRLEIPANSEVCFMGDYHGSVHSLLRNLWRLSVDGYLDDNFKFKKDNFYLIFLGDFVDRGRYGAEVWYSLMQLKLANWDKVHLLRGNHETSLASKKYGFLGWSAIKGKGKLEGEVCIKFETDIEKERSEQGEIGKKILNLYHFLPFAIFLGVKDKNEFVQCCHAGIAVNDGDTDLFDVKPFIKENKKFQKISKFQEGFQWSDFSQDKDDSDFASGCRGTKYGIEATVAGGQEYLNQNNLKAFFRGHQDQCYGFKMFFENEAQKNAVIEGKKERFGVYPFGPYHWKYIVSDSHQREADGFLVKDYKPIFTFTSASEGQSVPFDCYGIVMVGNGLYDNWRLKIYETGLPNELVSKIQDASISNRNKKYVAIGSITSDLRGAIAVEDKQLKINWLSVPLKEEDLRSKLGDMLPSAPKPKKLEITLQEALKALKTKFAVLAEQLARLAPGH
ncbi:serine/threonine protein phosphatase [bacterium]|nr:MAG: serine/threonine protein phosphatase [bacterium]